MKQKEAYEMIIHEDLNNIRNSFGCDGCVAWYWCTKNQKRKSRVPQDDCPDKLKKYMRQTHKRKEWNEME